MTFSETEICYVEAGEDGALRGGLHVEPDGDHGGPGQTAGHTQTSPDTGQSPHFPSVVEFN